MFVLPQAAGRAALLGALALALALTAAVMVGCSSARDNRPRTKVVHGDTVPTVAHLGQTSFTGPGPLASERRR